MSDEPLPNAPILWLREGKIEPLPADCLLCELETQRAVQKLADYNATRYHVHGPSSGPTVQYGVYDRATSEMVDWRDDRAEAQREADRLNEQQRKQDAR